MKKSYVNINTIILVISIIVIYFLVSRYMLSDYGSLSSNNTEPFTAGINSFLNKNRRDMKNRIKNVYDSIKSKIPRFR